MDNKLVTGFDDVVSGTDLYAKFGGVGGVYFKSAWSETRDGFPKSLMVQSVHVDTDGVRHALRTYLPCDATQEAVEGAENGMIRLLHTAGLVRAGSKVEEVLPQGPFGQGASADDVIRGAQMLLENTRPTSCRD